MAKKVYVSVTGEHVRTTPNTIVLYVPKLKREYDMFTEVHANKDGRPYVLPTEGTPVTQQTGA